MRISREDAKASVDASIEHVGTLTDVFPRGYGVMDAIRRNCLDCTMGMRAEVDACPIVKCPLWAYRFGRNPLHGRATSGEQDV